MPLRRGLKKQVENERSGLMRFFVEVDLDDEYPYHIVNFKSGKQFCASREMYFARGICEMLNYNTAKTKKDYIIILVAGGFLHMEFLKPSNIKKMRKDYLIEKYNQALQKIEEVENGIH